MSFGHSQGLKANSELEASVLRVAGVPSVELAREKTLSSRVFYISELVQNKTRKKNQRYINIHAYFGTEMP